MFVSQVDPTKPQQGNALTLDLRNNLATIKSELETIGNQRSFDITFSSPSLTWVVNHNLGVRPSIDVFSDGGVKMLAKVEHVSINQAIVSFNSLTTGFVTVTQ